MTSSAVWTPDLLPWWSALISRPPAFDTVCHQTLLGRLELEFGIHGVSLEWVASYLSDRTISVRVGKSSSAAVPVHVGIPRGSVLWPILFTTYIAPIGRLIEQHITNTLTILSYTPHSPFLPARASTALHVVAYVRAE